MLKGLHLTMLIGPGLPLPAPLVLMDAVTEIQVTNNNTKSGFQITFSVAKNENPINQLISIGFFDAISTRVVIIATLNGVPNVLIDGVITQLQSVPSNEASKSIVTITGEDISLLMDLIEITAPLPALPDTAKVYTLLSPFHFLGITPVVIPTMVSTISSPTNSWETATKQTPLRYLRNLAQENGYVFQIIPGPLPLQNIAYFGPDVNIPLPQKALSVNMDAHSNVENISFTTDGLAKKVNIYTIFDEVTKKITIPVPVPNINILKPPLGLRPVQPVMKTTFADAFSKKKSGEAAKKILSDLMSSENNPPSIKANGSLNVLRYNGILRSGMLVGVRGAGIAYDGLYAVDSVTHSIKKGEYKQSFTLSRDGIVSNVPALIV